MGGIIGVSKWKWRSCSGSYAIIVLFDPKIYSNVGGFSVGRTSFLLLAVIEFHGWQSLSASSALPIE